MPPIASKTAGQTLRAAIYDRVSDDRTGKGRSVAEQNEANRNECDEHGWTVVLTAADNDVSASRFAKGKARPGWEKIVAAVEAGKIDVLVLWEPSRGSRDLVVWATLLAACRARGVRIHVTSHSTTYNPQVGRQWRSLAEDGVDSGYESEKASDRIRRAMEKNAAAGRPHGRVPFGYERIYDSRTAQLIEQRPNPLTAPIVREIVARVAKGEALLTITRDLNARGVPSPTGLTWKHGVVRGIAMSPRYIAKRRYGADKSRGIPGSLIDGDWPALISEADHYAVVHLLSDETRKTTRPGKAKWLLSYLATCAECGSTLQGVAKPGRHPFYRCGANTCTAIRVDWLDDYVTAYLCKRLALPDAADVLSPSDSAAEALAARAELQELESELTSWRKSAAAGETTKATMAFMEADFTPRIEAARLRAEQPSMPGALGDLLRVAKESDGVNTYEAVLAHFTSEKMTVAAQRDVIRAVLTVAVGRAPVHGPNRKLDDSRVFVEEAAPAVA